jgi:hypothetical protein
MSKKKLGLLLLFSPLIIFILIITLFSLLPSDIPEIIDTLAGLMFFVGSPILFCIGLILLIKNRDKDKKFISNKVSKKRILIGKIVLFGIITPVLLYLGASVIYDLIKTKIVRTVVSEHCHPKYIFLPQEEEDEDGDPIEPRLKGTYEYVPDEYVWYWNPYEQGYYDLNRYIDTPESYLPEQVFATKQSWNLKNGYTLKVNCGEVDLRQVKMLGTYECSVLYNDTLLSQDVRRDIFCYGSNLKNCNERIGIVLYSNRYSDSAVEHLVVASKEGTSHNSISVYRLEDGEARFLPFKYEYKGEHFSDKDYMISSLQFEMYGVGKYGLFDLLVDGDTELVTFFQEPTMGVENNIRGIHNIWSVEDDGLYLRKSIMELIEDWGGTEEL